MSVEKIERILGEEAESLLGFSNPVVPRESLVIPGPDWVDKAHASSDRSPAVLRSLAQLFGHGRLAGTGYLAILPVDQGVEHSACASFAPNPRYFDPENIVKLAIEGGCSAVASTLGVLSSVARKYAHRIPFILKLNHNELLSHPNIYDQTMFASVRQAFDMGAVAVGATVYFGSPESRRQITEVSEAFELAHDLGMATVLWCYLRNDAFRVDGRNYETAADLTGQANHLGATLGADIVKQKLPGPLRGYLALNVGGEKYGKYDTRVYSELMSDHPIDLARYQVVNCYMGRVGLLNSGGESGKDDLKEAVRTAVINKRAGGMGLIIGRKAFQKPLEEGLEILEAVQEVYLTAEIEVA